MLPLEEEDQNAENEEQTLLDTTTIQMPRPAPSEEDDEDSEDEEATPLNTTVIQMSTLEEDHNSDESRHFGLKILFDKLGSQEPYKLSLPPGRVLINSL